MLNRLRHPDLRPVIAALYAVAMLWLGLAHRPPVVATPGSAGILQVLLQDGSPDAWCLNDPGQPPVHAPGRGSGLCDACLLTAAIGLPPATAGLPVPAGVATGRAVARPALAVAARAVDRPRSRGPPLLA